MPVGGIVFITMQYLMGLKRLGFDVYYVEAHARTPSMLMKDEHDDASALAAAFIADMMRRFDLGDDRWAFHALHDDGQCYGMSEEALRRLYREAALIFNLHGGTTPRPEHYETNRLVYVGTDPVADEVAVHQRRCRGRSTTSRRTARSSPGARTTATPTAACPLPIASRWCRPGSRS